MEDKIQEAAEEYLCLCEKYSKTEPDLFGIIKQDFISGAKSQAAKEYWQQGMYSEEEICKMIEQCDSEGGIRWDEVTDWFNSKKK